MVNLYNVFSYEYKYSPENNDNLTLAFQITMYFPTLAFWKIKINLQKSQVPGIQEKHISRYFCEKQDF